MNPLGMINLTGLKNHVVYVRPESIYKMVSERQKDDTLDGTHLHHENEVIWVKETPQQIFALIQEMRFDRQSDRNETIAQLIDPFADMLRAMFPKKS